MTKCDRRGKGFTLKSREVIDGRHQQTPFSDIININLLQVMLYCIIPVSWAFLQRRSLGRRPKLPRLCGHEVPLHNMATCFQSVVKPILKLHVPSLLFNKNPVITLTALLRNLFKMLRSYIQCSIKYNTTK